MGMNKIFIGDCLDILHYRLRPDSVDLIYLDPPFNSGRNYGEFDDKWKSMEAYIDYMKERLLMCKRVLKETGSIYLHCDSAFSHYLKILMDQIFGRSNYRNEIVWCYSGGGAGKKFFAKKHDIILFYTSTSVYTFNLQYRPYSVGSVQRGFTKYKIKLGGYTIRKEGALQKDWWDDLLPISSPVDKEKIGYPTQKPQKLLDRIIRSSSNENDIVLDPFCGSGTTLHVANSLGRRWIGIDFSEIAIRKYAVPRLEVDLTCKPFKVLSV